MCTRSLAVAVEPYPSPFFLLPVALLLQAGSKRESFTGQLLGRGDVRYDQPMQETPLNLGVLGASRIVSKALCDVAGGLVRVVAIAARDLSRAEKFAEEHGIPQAYGSYQELIADPKIDAVYVALPCSEHIPWTLAALRSGKHVLCEKPFALDIEEAAEAVALAKNTGMTLMEAHHWRYHPLVASAEEAFRSLGELQSIEAVFTGALNNPGDIRCNPLLGPGVTMDFGCYLLQWANWAARSCGVDQPTEVMSANLSIDPNNPGVDMAAEVALNWGPVIATLASDMRDGVPFRAYVRVKGTHKTIHFENPLLTEGTTLTIASASGPMSDESLVIDCPPNTSTYREQLKAFREAVRTGKAPLTSGEDTLTTQRLLDAIYQQAGVISRRELRLAAFPQA